MAKNNARTIGAHFGELLGTFVRARDKVAASLRGETPPPLQPETNADIRFEGTDVSYGYLMLIAAALLVFVWVVIGLLYFYFGFLTRRSPKLTMETGYTGQIEHRLPPAPRLQASPKLDLYDLRVKEDKVLNSYRWIDRSRGSVAIPIGRAMEVLAQRGIPPQKNSPAYFSPVDGTRDTGFEGKVAPEPR